MAGKMVIMLERNIKLFTNKILSNNEKVIEL